MYKSLHHFIIDILQKCILEAAIDRLDIQLRTISPFNQMHGFSMILYIVRYVNATLLGDIPVKFIGNYFVTFCTKH